MSDEPPPAAGADTAAAAARIRARLLTRLHHDLRAPLARIVGQLAVADADAGAAHVAITATAQRQLRWLSDLQACARYEVEPPELTPAATYLHALLQEVCAAPAGLPALAVLDGRQLRAVLERLAAHCDHLDGAALALQASVGAGAVTLHVATGAEAGGQPEASWRAVPTTLDSEMIDPGLILAAQLVRAMGGCLQQAGNALRFSVVAALAHEADAMPPSPRFDMPPPFGDGHLLLLLEPHAAMRDYLTEILDSAGFELCYAASELGAARPALVLCTEATLDHTCEAGVPVLLHAQLPPPQPEQVAALLYKPAPPQQLLDTVQRLLELREEEEEDGRR